MPDDRAMVNLRKHYPTESIVCMAPQLCRNVAMDVYQRERASKWATAKCPHCPVCYSVLELDGGKGSGCD